MTEPGDSPAPVLPGPARTFLAQHDAAVVLDARTPEAPTGRHPRVLVLARDAEELRATTWPVGVTTAAIGLLLGPGEAALTYVPPLAGPDPVVFRARRLPRHRWCLLRFAEPVEVGPVLERLARQAVWHDRAPLPAALGTISSSPGEALRLDERVLNPAGFLVEAPGPVVDLDDVADPEQPVDAARVAALRTTAGVRVADWSTPDAGVHVARLAIAGVPVTGPVAPPGVLEPAVATAVAAPVDLSDPAAREEHSLVLRRAALDAHATGWAGRPRPAVSVVLATRRADMLEHALAQVARQRGVERLELVLAPHGFTPDVGAVRAALERGGGDVSLQVLPQPDDALFGDVLQAAYLASGGDVVLKMDDDDWYAPETVLDLLRARAYSGAELVGMPPGRHYLVERDLTLWRRATTEVYARFVAGGTMLVDRPVLREVGGFRPVRRYVDAQLLDAVLAAGGAVYRTHGLGYVLRRNPSGHTWQVEEETLLDPARLLATWPGFHPSRLMEL